MWMRGEQLKSSLLSFSLQIQRENRETEIVSGMKKETKFYLISIRETYFEGWMKTKEPLALWDLSHEASRTSGPTVGALKWCTSEKSD